MDKLQKVWTIKNILGITTAHLAEPVASDNDVKEQKYIITKEQLVEYANYFLDSALEEKFSLAEDDSEVINYLKQLGVE